MGMFPLIPSGFQKTLIQEFNADSEQLSFDIVLPSTNYKLLLIEFWGIAGVETTNVYCAFDPKLDVTTIPSGQYSKPRGMMAYYAEGQNSFILLRDFNYTASTKTVHIGVGAIYRFSIGYEQNNQYCVVKRIWGVK